MFKPAANFEHLTANNNTHLQLAGSNNFRSYIVLRQTAVQSVQLARTSAIFCAGRVSVSKSKCQKKTKFSEAWRTKSCKPENNDRRNANETIRLLKIKRNFDEIRVTSSAKEAPSDLPRARAKNMQVESGSSSTRPAWALAFGLPAAEPEDLRPPRPRSRLARASTLPGSPRPAAPRNFPDAGTLLLASVEPAGPVPSGAHSVASERLVRRALGREAANAKVTSKKSKFRG